MKKIPSMLMLCSAALCGCSTYRAEPITQERVDRALQPPRMETVRAEASAFKHPMIQPLSFDDRDGLTPEEAAIFAVLANPQLRAARDGRGVASAQVIQAGILPNPQLAYSVDVPTGSGAGLVNATTLGFSWDITSLLAHGAQVDAARAHAASVDLDIAWQEWQVAQGARIHAYDLMAVRGQLALARDIEAAFATNLVSMQKAADLRLKTDTDVAAAAESVHQAHVTVLDLEKEANHERFALNAALGLPADADVSLQAGAGISNAWKNAGEFFQGLENRRLDLMALRAGYESEEASLRAAVRSQFPKIGIDVNKARDTSDVQTRGYGASVDLPFFDRGQGQVATEKATRKQLFDEYVARVADAQSKIAELWSDYLAAQKELEAAESSMSSLQHIATGYEALYAQNRVDALTYYQARSDLASRRIELLKLRRDVTDLALSLEVESGRSSMAKEKE